MDHFMINIQTTGLVASSAIVSIAVVPFSFFKSKVSDDVFYYEVDWEAQLEDGRTQSEGAMEIWDNRPPDVRDQLYGLDSLEDMMTDLSNFINRRSRVWGKPPLFTFSILEDCYMRKAKLPPWQFYSIRDFFTFQSIYEEYKGEFRPAHTSGTGCAITDATKDARDLVEMYNYIANKRNGK